MFVSLYVGKPTRCVLSLYFTMCVFFFFSLGSLIYCHFQFVACTFVTCFNKDQSINQSINFWGVTKKRKGTKRSDPDPNSDSNPDTKLNPNPNYTPNPNPAPFRSFTLFNHTAILGFIDVFGQGTGRQSDGVQPEMQPLRGMVRINDSNCVDCV